MKATLKEKQNEADNIITFWFDLDNHPKYEAGQFIEINLPHDHPDDRGIKRWFTLSSSPKDSPGVSITTKFAEKSSTFKTALKNLRVGDVVDMSEPMGDFILPKDKTIPLVFVAGGMGITPFHSIIKYLTQIKEERTIQLIYVVAREEELLFHDLWQQYRLSDYSPIVSMPRKGWKGEKGPLTAERILSFTGEVANKLIYISGPEIMVETFNDKLQKLGVPTTQLVGDYFPNYGAI